ncbi:5-formyltetrahydrofolate cyclo-ligase [Tepidibacillus fermentans]|uniref:5-formyltetrahydrofolate cyclo-ligase n=1 Tax=Tepidibacillus fermentans TaxID=1281767 RepID=A0A4R3K9I4_9BACI|nr:5-formyltetrahydrofolate cyclo-ligase [Tepidibacillus fermentans]TCS79569.1 5-formyltetrahydrofolate cyclo-ligase [Tepidibacillus fermentans]
MEGRMGKQTKESLRRFFTEKRNQLDPKIVRNTSAKIVQHLLHHPIYQNSNTLMVYLSFRNEVDLTLLIENAWQQRKKVIVPKTNPTNKQMVPYFIQSWNELEEGNYGILEPLICDKNPFPIDQIELVLVPGLAFDQEGYRLGYGGGYYDRFFDRYRKLPYLIGVAYDFQLVQHLPRDDHDYSVNEICTEKGCIKL